MCRWWVWVRVGTAGEALPPRPVAPASAWLSHEPLAHGHETPAALSPWEGSPTVAAARTLTGRATVWRGLPSGSAWSSRGLARGPPPGFPSDASRCLICRSSASGWSGRLQTRRVGSCWEGGRTKPRPRCPCPVRGQHSPAGQGFAPQETMPGMEGYGGTEAGRAAWGGSWVSPQATPWFGPDGEGGGEPHQPGPWVPAGCLPCCVRRLGLGVLGVEGVTAFLEGFGGKEVSRRQSGTLEARAGPGRAADGLATG